MRLGSGSGRRLGFQNTGDLCQPDRGVFRDGSNLITGSFKHFYAEFPQGVIVCDLQNVGSSHRSTPDDTKTYSLFYALLLSICCRYTAAFFFCASSNSRFNSLTIAISLAGSVSATASRQRSRQSLRASWVIDASQKRKKYTRML